MLLTYPQKRSLIDHFSREENWQNRFNLSFFTDTTRKWNTSRRLGQVLREVSHDETRIVFTHESGAVLYFQKREDGSLLITDEAGRHMLVDGGGLQSNWARLVDPHLPAASENVHEVPGVRICIFFNDKGCKSIYFADWGRQIDIPGPEQDIATPLQKGAQIHVATISESTAESWGLQAGRLMDAVKLVIACDFGIEPRINAQNVPEAYTLHVRREDPHMPAAWRRGDEIVAVEIHQKAWRDTTQFEGGFVPVPDRFYTEIGGGGLNVITSLGQREAIWSQGDVYRNVVEAGAAPVATLNAGTTPAHILNLLARGDATRDRRGREWNYILAQTRDMLAVAPRVRGAVRDQFGLSARHCAVITFDEDLCIIAMNSHALDAASNHTAGKQAILQRLIEEDLEKPPAAAVVPQGGASVTRLRPGH